MHQALNIGSAVGGGTVGRSSVIEMSFVTRVNGASPGLAYVCAAGIPMTATLSIRKAGGKQEDYVKVTFTVAVLSNYKSLGVSGADLVPRDEFTLAFGTMRMDYRTQKADGSLGASIKKGWDFTSNRSL